MYYFLLAITPLEHIYRGIDVQIKPTVFKEKFKVEYDFCAGSTPLAFATTGVVSIEAGRMFLICDIN